jgi:hypothetical protein
LVHLSGLQSRVIRLREIQEEIVPQNNFIFPGTNMKVVREPEKASIGPASGRWPARTGNSAWANSKNLDNLRQDVALCIAHFSFGRARGTTWHS